MQKKEIRSLKVYEQTGYHYQPTPAIILKGNWLQDWGFSIHTPVSVTCEEGKLIITKTNSS